MWSLQATAGETLPPYNNTADILVSYYCLSYISRKINHIPNRLKFDLMGLRNSGAIRVIKDISCNPCKRQLVSGETFPSTLSCDQIFTNKSIEDPTAENTWHMILACYMTLLHSSLSLYINTSYFHEPLSTLLNRHLIYYSNQHYLHDEALLLHSHLPDTSPLLPLLPSLLQQQQRGATSQETTDLSNSRPRSSPR